MRLTYWVCENRSDVPAYNLRATTRREANELRAESGHPEDFSKPYKVAVDYDNGFDLVCQCFGEGASFVELNPE